MIQLRMRQELEWKKKMRREIRGEEKKRGRERKEGRKGERCVRSLGWLGELVGLVGLVGWVGGWASLALGELVWVSELALVGQREAVGRVGLWCARRAAVSMDVGGTRRGKN